jgi:hypothetical protein
MRSILLVLLLSLHLPISATPKSISPDSANRDFQVVINKNVELLGFVYFLGYEGAESEKSTYSPKTKARYAYGIELYRQYKAHANSRHLAVAIGFAQDIWLDYFINLLVQLDDFPNAKLTDQIDSTYYLRFSAKKNPEEARQNASLFIEAMNQLWKEVDFGTYLDRNRNKYNNALAQVSSELPDSLFIPAMEHFYQMHLDSYILVPSLTIPPGMGFGIKYNAGNEIHAYHVFGAFGIPSFTDTTQLDMGFGDKQHLLELSTHEFGHSFVNPVINSLPDSLIINTKQLYDPIKEAMSNQGYTTWKACLTEHFVRAGEIMIARNLGNSADAARLKEYYMNGRKFIYLPVILEALETYNLNRNTSYREVVEKAVKKLSR